MNNRIYGVASNPYEYNIQKQEQKAQQETQKKAESKGNSSFLTGALSALAVTGVAALAIAKGKNPDKTIKTIVKEAGNALTSGKLQEGAKQIFQEGSKTVEKIKSATMAKVNTVDLTEAKKEATSLLAKAKTKISKIFNDIKTETPEQKAKLEKLTEKLTTETEITTARLKEGIAKTKEEVTNIISNGKKKLSDFIEQAKKGTTQTAEGVHKKADYKGSWAKGIEQARKAGYDVKYTTNSINLTSPDGLTKISIPKYKGFFNVDFNNEQATYLEKLG